MFISVKLLNGFQEPLLYAVPPDLEKAITIGTIVHVPLRGRSLSAVVTHTYKQKPNSPFTIKPVVGIEELPDDPLYAQFMDMLASYYQIEVASLLKRIKHFLHLAEQTEDTIPYLPSTAIKQLAVTLTDEQQKVCDFLVPRIKNSEYTPTVIHGVTGSGKTEIYKELIYHAIQGGKNVLFILPEVTLALAFHYRLRQELPDTIMLHSFHSATPPREKKAVWQALLSKKPIVIIGVHLPVLLPIGNLGLIIIDEEHDAGYQEKKHPKINTKEAAILRAHTYNIPIILGSATPSFQTLHNVEAKQWHFFQLRKRFAGTFPTVKTALLSQNKERKHFWLTQELIHAIKDRLAKKEQIILFLNRRGYSFFVQCKLCSFIFYCPNCSVSLTLHDDTFLACHYCTYAIKQPQRCPSCISTQSEFLKKGIGTQQVVALLSTIFPNATIVRADMDTTRKKNAWTQTIQKILDGTVDIIVGTQTITKGYDFPRVTLVGIVWADLQLHFPAYNASEIALQQLIQVAGRAGRKQSDSLVIVQAMQDHPLFAYIDENNYLSFFKEAMGARKELGYPPCKRLLEVELRHKDEETIEQESHTLSNKMSQLAIDYSFDATILGPAKPPIHTINNVHSRKIYVKSSHIGHIIALIRRIDRSRYACSLFFTPNP